MNIESLQIELIRHGYRDAAELLPLVQSNENKIQNLHQILDCCHIEEILLPDDIRILYEQVRSIKHYHKQYEDILFRDVQTIITELVRPSGKTSSLFLGEDDFKNAIHLYIESFQHVSDAQLELGKLYKKIGHDDWAFIWYEAAANAGITEAIYWIGNFYYDGKVVEKNLRKTYESYQKAALAGYPDAVNNYADMYLRGEFVEKDEKRAYELFLEAAGLGVAESMYTLGYMYENGVGIEKDMEQSKYWFTQSALHGDVYAANRLGHEAVERGDGYEAIRWYTLAADQGDVDGEVNLATCYESGIGTPVNLKKAKYWYQKAALKGDAEAKERLKVL